MSDRERDQALIKWLERPEDQRKSAHTEAFADELWQGGIRLAKTQHDHRQHVMAVIRFKINCE